MLAALFSIMKFERESALIEERNKRNKTGERLSMEVVLLCNVRLINR